MARILLVSEDSDNIILNKLILEQSGHECLTVLTAEETLFHLQNSNIDVLYLDVFSEQFDVVEFYRQLKTNPEFCSLPVIIYTARVLSFMSSDLTEYGDTIFVMPLEVEKLVAKVKELTDQENEGDELDH